MTRYKNLDIENCNLKAETKELTKQLKENEKRSTQEIQQLKENLNLNKDERNNVSENFQQLFSINKQLQHELETIQEQLGKKDFEIIFLSKNRYVITLQVALFPYPHCLFSCVLNFKEKLF